MNDARDWRRHWRPTPASLTPASDCVDVWLYYLPAFAAKVDAYATLLSPDDRQRAGAFRNAAKRQQFILTRALLRRRLGWLLRRDAGALALTTTTNGKPVLADTALAFNVSHSGAFALIAVSERRALGVDVERINADTDCEAIVRRFFSAAERAEFQALPATLKTRAFFAGWTRKEAFIKAAAAPCALNHFDAALDPALDEAPVKPHDSPLQWTAYTLPVDDRYAASLVNDPTVNDQPFKIRRWRDGKG